MTEPSLSPIAQSDRPINSGARIGHVHLKVADLDRALAFYTGVLGFSLEHVAFKLPHSRSYLGSLRIPWLKPF
jgi:catechol-2,3-dioxygenase